MQVFATRRLPGVSVRGWDVWEHGRPPSREEIVARASEADGLLCMLTDPVDEALLDALPSLRVVSQMAVGVDNIDLRACTARGIPVGHTPGVLSETTADLAWALILAAARRVTEAERVLRSGGWRFWSPDLLLGRDVCGATLGVVGMGAIGQAVARRAEGFDMHVVFATRERSSLERVLREADVVTLHVPLTVETRGLIGSSELALMKPTAILVNTSRGGVVDEEALVDALRTRRLFAAGLDVYRTEPLPADSPFLALDNVVLLPHIGSASVATRERMARMAVANLEAGLRGERLPHCANPEIYGS
jgi:glyoxylate reductase